MTDFSPYLFPLGSIIPAALAYLGSRSNTKRKLGDCEEKHQECLDKNERLDARVATLEVVLAIKRPNNDPPRY